MSDVIIYDENLNTVAMKESTGVHTSPLTETEENEKASSVNNKTKKKKNSGKSYIEDAKARSNCRSKRRQGIIRSIRDLKITTKDEVYIEFHRMPTKLGDTRSITRYASSNTLMQEKRSDFPTRSLHSMAATPSTVVTSSLCNIPWPWNSK